MPHVASDTRAQGAAHARVSAPRPAQGNAQGNERDQGPSFESMLDDNAAAATERAQTQASMPVKTSEPAAKTDKAENDKADGTETGVEPTATAETVVVSPSVAPAIASDEAEGKAGVPASEDDEAQAAKAETTAVPAPAAISKDAKPAPDSQTDDNTGDTASDNVAVTPQLPVAPVPSAQAAAEQPAKVAEDAPAIVAANIAPQPRAAKGETKSAAADTVMSKTNEAPAPDETAATASESSAPPENGLRPATPEAAQKADAQARGEVRGETPARAPHMTAKSDAAPAPATDTAAQPRIDFAPPVHAASAAHQAAATTQATAAPAPAAQPAPQTPQAPAVPLAGLAVEIAANARSGTNHFEIRLDPPELGRIEVRLDVDRDGHITSHVVADRRDTLDLLQRDSATLQRALQDAGLKTADNALQFSLRDQSGQPQPDRQQQGRAGRLVIEDDTLPAIDALQATQSRLASRRGGIDIRI